MSARTPEQKKQWMELLQKVISDLAATTADLKNRIKKDVSGNRTDTQRNKLEFHSHPRASLSSNL